ncbi:MAG: RNB domain-containing ribonuclease, partial [Candidatus Paceibacterota bacterium]
MKDRPRGAGRPHADKPRQSHGKAGSHSHSKEKEPKTISGVLSVNSKGTGFLENPPSEVDIEIANENLATALHGDTVEAEILPLMSRGRHTGRILSIQKRAKMRFVGTVEAEGGNHFLVPDDKRLYRDILLPTVALGGATPGDKALAEIVSWADAAKSPVGSVLEVIGRHGEHNAEMKSIVLERGLAYDYPLPVIREAETIEKNEKKITQEEIAKRRDIRRTTTFTIDPVDAKDFDDAISVQKLPDGKYEIGVHIADVSHYVREGTALDREARERGFSVYLVDRTIPMLPEVLSNELCSLNPNEDKLSFSSIFVMDMNGRIHDRWFGKTVMNSDKRFTYESAQEVLDQGRGDYHDELLILNTIAKKLRKAKEEMGAIDFEQDEVKFVLDETGKPIRIIKKTRKDTHKLVEEFMLLANREVAHFMS